MVGYIGVTLFVFGLVAVGLYQEQKQKSKSANENRELLLLTQDEFLKMQNELELDFVKDTVPTFQKLADQLEDAYKLDYQLHIYNRLVRETRFSQETILELMFEQKRFLLMASILKKVPMFSNAVDEVWHQQLMFTNEYRDFTQKFAGQFIHHSPNVDDDDGVDDKFLFDMMYKKLFLEKSFSSKSWGSPFYATLPSDNFLAEWRETDPSLLQSRYFFEQSETNRAVQGLIREIKDDMEAAESKEKLGQFLEKQSRIVRDSSAAPGTLNELTLPYVLWAAADPHKTYAESVGLAKIQSKNKSNSDGGNSGFFGNFSNHKESSDDAWSGSDSSDSGGGSSCGSSCGSS